MVGLGWFVDAGAATAGLKRAAPTSVKEDFGPWYEMVPRPSLEVEGVRVVNHSVRAPSEERQCQSNPPQLDR